MKMLKTRPKMCITGYVHSVINMYMICMQIVSLEIVTISITSAYYLLRCNSSRHPAGVWHPPSKQHRLFFLRLHILLPSCWLPAQKTGRLPSAPLFRGGSPVCVIVLQTRKDEGRQVQPLTCSYLEAISPSPALLWGLAPHLLRTGVQERARGQHKNMSWPSVQPNGKPGQLVPNTQTLSSTEK